MRASFRTASPKFLRSMHAKVFDRKSNEFPVLYLGSKVPWLGIHEQGGTIRGWMLIPLLPQHRRIGRKAFARIIDALMRSGNAWFVEKNGQQILMAENLAENARPLTRFRRAERERSGAKRLRRGQEIPIAVLVRRVSGQQGVEGLPVPASLATQKSARDCAGVARQRTAAPTSPSATAAATFPNAELQRRCARMGALPGWLVTRRVAAASARSMRSTSGRWSRKAARLRSASHARSSSLFFSGSRVNENI